VRISIALLLLVSWVHCDRASAAEARPCCGEITAAGKYLEAVFDSMNVETLWLAHEHVNWETGRPDRSADYEGPGKATHCSAFAAAVGKRLDVYMLRPPEHGQILLASAQAAWFSSAKGRAAGWREEPDPREAQRLANHGRMVVVVFQSADPHRPGHIAIVRPSDKSMQALQEDGPRIIQAGQRNYNSTSTRNGFKAHAGAWPSGVHYYGHVVKSEPENLPVQ
jgi:hypothetical protein